MKEQDNYQLIDSYLNGELNADDKLAVESRIQSDSEFAETFSILEKVYGKIEDKGAINLVHRLHELSEQYPANEVDLSPEKATPNVIPPKTASTPPPSSSDKSGGGMWKLLLPLLLVGAAGLFYFLNKGEEVIPEVPEIPKVETPSNNTTPPEVETPVEKTIEEKAPVKETPPKQEAPPKKEEKKQPKLYAAADFEVNTMLDKMIGTTTRSELSFEVSSPQLNQNFPESATTISFSGKTNATDTQKGTFRLLNNKRIDISQQDINATGSFNFSTKIPKPGLYYYTVKFGSKTYVGKFTVGKR